MSITSSTNGSYTFKAGEPLFIEEQSAASINILAKGTVDVYVAESFKLFSLNQNIFIGANDLFLSRKHSLSYRAATDCTIFSYFVNNMDDIETLFSQKSDYSSYIINSISNILENAYVSLKNLERLVKSLSILSDNLCIYFWLLKDKHGFSYESQLSVFRNGRSKLDELRQKRSSLPVTFDVKFMGTDHFEYNYYPTEEIDIQKMNYYTQFCSMDSDLKRQFLNESFVISHYTCMDCSLLLESIILKLKEAFNIAMQTIETLYSHKQTSILGEFLVAGAQIEKSAYDPTDAIELQQYMISQLKHVINMIKNDYNHSIDINVNLLEEKSSKLIAELKQKITIASISASSFEEKQGVPEELANSAEKILAYSNISKERYDLFMNSLKAFRLLKDKLSDDSKVRALRKDITTVFFEVYEAVLRRVIAENNQDKLLHMFLTYAYMDEKLLSPKNLWTLYELCDVPASDEQSSVFSMKNWLQLIYKKEKNPSINGFSMDYFDVFRELKKQGEVREEDKTIYDNNQDGRLSFEITNFFIPNQRLCNRHLGTYFPILYEEVIVKDLDKALITPKKLGEAIQRVLDIDFSAFHREISYFNLKKKIEKEFIMQAVRPDIILMPAYGENALMWQEISGRLRNTPGRFIVPIFSEGNLDDMVQKLIGEFRWELCKTMLGVSWNDISIKSLTSEYMDYLQFFKKNKDISEESKEKIKQQIKKHRNISKDVFCSDYIAWLNYESNGTIRLNKFVRDILYKHCPFSKEIRQKLTSHPSFATTAQQFEIIRAKQAKDLENRYARYTNQGIILDEEMIETLHFYKNL